MSRIRCYLSCLHPARLDIVFQIHRRWRHRVPNRCCLTVTQWYMVSCYDTDCSSRELDPEDLNVAPIRSPAYRASRWVTFNQIFEGFIKWVCMLSPLSIVLSWLTGATTEAQHARYSSFPWTSCFPFWLRLHSTFLGTSHSRQYSWAAPYSVMDCE